MRNVFEDEGSCKCRMTYTRYLRNKIMITVSLSEAI